MHRAGSKKSKTLSLPMKLSELKSSGHWPTLLTAFLYFDVSFMVWTLLGPLGAQVGEALHLDAAQKGLMVATPTLAGAFLRIVLGVTVDRLGAKTTGIIAQLIVIAGLAFAWLVGLKDFHATLLMGFILGFGGASFAVALPQAGRWYPPHLQGVVMGLAGAGNIGTVIDALFAPRIAAAIGWKNVFGVALIPTVLVLLAYTLFSKEAKVTVKKKTFGDYFTLLKDKDAYWFCFYYLITFGGFVGLATSYVLFFKGEYKLTPIQAGDLAALCTGAGALLRPVGGAIADRTGGIRSLYFFYVIGAAALVVTGLFHVLNFNVATLLIASAALGMGNGAVFQLLPQRFAKDIGVMTGLVGAAGGVGGFYLAASLGYFKQTTGSYSVGFYVFAGLCMIALAGLTLVKTRWRTTWGAVAGARI